MGSGDRHVHFGLDTTGGFAAHLLASRVPQRLADLPLTHIKRCRGLDGFCPAYSGYICGHVYCFITETMRAFQYPNHSSSPIVVASLLITFPLEEL